MIQKAITMTSKGTFTLPAKVRKSLGVTKAGDKLMLHYHEQSKTIELKKAPDLLALQAEVAAALPKTAKPFPGMETIRQLKHEEYIRDHLA